MEEPSRREEPSRVEQRRVRYAEHVGQPVWMWLLALILALSVGFAYLGYVGPLWATLVAAGVMALLSWWLWSARALVAVDDEALTVGPARLPLQFVGAVTPLDAEAARLLGGRDADARAYVLVRGSVATAVRVDVDDPADPTPYWLFSSARPRELADALVAARAAHLLDRPEAG